MKNISIAVDLEYDRSRVSPNEVVFNVRRALDDYFNRFDSEYEEDALKVTEVYENVTALSGQNP